ncbi:hypothetical protein PAAG_11710 [Paracoccidioides lutzii Pb01]|uniref:Uncharacterized protein n=1 Tax=Paracoccidioides lutzii (strain ATCC MYA-826 / Pb01) TaxID=502779 RepID=A0A0A2V5G0_PARBA|nr:hypothetical protein PAAG_11710 [Paracoccidioides lutzii Pb01]KGQ01582.1 hypothetical protein PAAG_11710 [Paracoccidioides lutzii Pb01]
MLPYPQFMMFLRSQPANVGRMSLGGAKSSSIMTASLLQTRNITQKHILRMREAEETWKGYAEEIKAGNRKSFLELMEERGLVNKVVGE